MALIKVPDGGFYVDDSQVTVDYVKKSISIVGGGAGGDSLSADYAQNDSSAADYIKNRPFYAEPWITWDGSTEGREVVNAPGTGEAVQISTETPTQEELLGASVVLSDGRKKTLSADDFQSGTNLLSVLIGEGVLITYADNVDVGGIVVPKKGFYVMKSIEQPDYPYLVSLQGNKTVYRIDPKFIQKPFFISARAPISSGSSYYRIYLPENKERNKEITMEDVDESLLNLLINGIIKKDTTGNDLYWENVLSISTVGGPQHTVVGYLILTNSNREKYLIGESPVS